MYKDFRTAVLDILGAQENQEALLNGVAGMGRGVDDIPGSIVSVDTAPSQPKVIAAPPAHQVELNHARASPPPVRPNPPAGPMMARPTSHGLLHRQQSRVPNTHTHTIIVGVLSFSLWLAGCQYQLQNIRTSKHPIAKYNNNKKRKQVNMNVQYVKGRKLPPATSSGARVR